MAVKALDFRLVLPGQPGVVDGHQVLGVDHRIDLAILSIRPDGGQKPQAAGPLHIIAVYHIGVRFFCRGPPDHGGQLLRLKAFILQDPPHIGLRILREHIPGKGQLHVLAPFVFLLVYAPVLRPAAQQESILQAKALHGGLCRPHLGNPKKPAQSRAFSDKLRLREAAENQPAALAGACLQAAPRRLVPPVNVLGMDAHRSLRVCGQGPRALPIVLQRLAAHEVLLCVDSPLPRNLKGGRVPAPDIHDHPPGAVRAVLVQRIHIRLLGQLLQIPDKAVFLIVVPALQHHVGHLEHQQHHAQLCHLGQEVRGIEK